MSCPTTSTTSSSHSSPSSFPKTDSLSKGSESPLTPKSNSSPASIEGGWTPRLKGWWTTYLNWRENVGDDQLGCNCSPAQECQCELRMVTTPGPV